MYVKRKENISQIADSRKKIPKEKWFKNTGTKHHLEDNTHRISADMKIGSKLRFVGMQKEKEPEEPNILLDTGSTISCLIITHS